jgi:hypothetical protein
LVRAPELQGNLGLYGIAYLKNISPKTLRKPQHFRVSSPETIQTLIRQQHPRGMLVISNLLSLKKIEKVPAITGLSLLETAKEHKAFVCTILDVTHLE